MTVKFTIIIPVKSINNFVRETVPSIQALTRHDWELIILPNEQDQDEWRDRRIRIVSSGKVGPAKKRDMGGALANGEILVFLDDDSYPEPSILDIASKYFEEEAVAALGGPAITPPQDSFWQRVSGAVFLSKLSGGAPERYVPVGEVRPVDDWPSVNLMVRRQAFLDIGGFNSPYWPGEDTKLCLDLIQKTKKKILYIPQMKVWHHRRAGLAAHLKQVGGYGLHRGYFVKHYPETSRKLLYFAPSAFVLFALASSFVPDSWPSTTWLFLTGWIVYGLALLKAWLDMLEYETLTVALAGVVYTVATHLWYGTRFIQGLLTQNLVSRLR
jgi:cellulose synthase/poly-beta-1,6-N-acetylglucosamine synthase-like glycosyltransferase